MHIVVRLVFWSGLLGVAASLAVPTATSAVPWGFALFAFLGASAVACLSFIASVAIKPASLAHDPASASRHRASTGTIYSLAATLVLLVFGTVALVQTLGEHERIGNRSTERVNACLNSSEYTLVGTGSDYDQLKRRLRWSCERENGTTESEYGAMSDLATGQWTGVGALVGAGVAFITFLVFALLRLVAPSSRRSAAAGYPSYGGYSAPLAAPFRG